MSKHLITATEASRSLSDVFNKVYYNGDSFEIKRGRETIAKIVPVKAPKRGMKVGELNDFFANLPHLSEEEAKSFSKDIAKIRKQKPRNPWI